MIDVLWRLCSQGPALCELMVFVLLTSIVSKLIFASFSMGMRDVRALGLIALAQFAVVPPRIFVFAVFAHGLFHPVSPFAAAVCASVTFVLMALVEWQLYEHAGLTERPALLSVVLNVCYLVVLGAFCLVTGTNPFF